jgi:glyceraldehyde 3-phosphate dehydrogenase
MSVAKMGINGFGRIGRLVFRSAFTQNANNARVMAINDPFMDKDYLIYLLSYDSVHGIYFNFLKYFRHRSFQGHHRES